MKGSGMKKMMGKSMGSKMSHEAHEARMGMYKKGKTNRLGRKR